MRGHRPSIPARLGQHFLVNQNVARRIVAELGPVAGPVLEIGPGRGVLTSLLLEASPDREVVAVEKDPLLCHQLEERFPERLRVLNRDIVEVSPETLFPAGTFHLIGNLPYLISKEIVDWLIVHRACIGSGVVMLQKDFVDKLLAKPGARRRNAQGVMFQLLFTASKILTVSPGSFSPPPRVDSTVIKFNLSPKWDRASPALYEFLHGCFASPRKTLANNLATMHDRDTIQTVLERVKLRADSRAGDLTPEMFLSLFEAFQQRK